jgi:hypothetical protein
MGIHAIAVLVDVLVANLRGAGMDLWIAVVAVCTRQLPELLGRVRVGLRSRYRVGTKPSWSAS